MAANAWESFGLVDPESFKVAPIEPQPDPERGDFGRGFGIAFREVKPLAQAAVGLAGATVGSDAVRDWGYSGYQDAMNKIAPDRKDTDELTTAYEKAKTGDLGAIVDWVQYGLGYVTGQAAQSIAVGVAGAAAGGMAAGPGGAVAGGVGGAVTGAAGGTAVRALATKMAGSIIEKQAAKIAEVQLAKLAAEGVVTEAAKAAVMQQAKAAAVKSVGQAIGSGAGTVALTSIQEGGSIFADAMEEAKKQGRELDGTDLARIWAGTAGATVLESAADMLGLGALSGRVKLGSGTGGMVGRAATGGAILGASGGATEVGQTAFERFGAGKELTSDEAVKDYINSGALGVLGDSAMGGISGAAHRAPPVQKTNEEIIKDIVGAPDLESAVAETQKVFDQNTVPLAILTAADNTGMVNRMSDDALLSAQARFEEESAQAQRVMREHAFRQAEQPPANVGGILDQRQADLANQEQGAREQGLDQMRADQARAAVNTPIAEGQTSDLGSGRTDAGIQGPMQAAFARLQEQRNAQTGSARDAVGSAVQPAVLESAVGVPGGQNLVEPARRDAGAGGVQPVSGRTVDGSPASVAAGPRGVLPSDGPSAIDRLNQSLAAERKQRGVDTGQPSVTMVEPDSLPVTRQRAKNGGETLSKHEFETVKKFAELFGKKVELFRHNRPADNAMNADSFDGAVIDSDTQTIFLNADAKDAHHLVVAGHEIGHQMKKDAPDLYKTLESRLKSDLKDGNLANFARYYGTAEKDVYAKLRNADSRGALVEEFISDLIGNRSAEYRTMLDIFGAAKGSKDAGMIYKVAQFLVDFIDGLLAKINRTKFATDALVGDLKKVRTEVRAALKEYAVRQNREGMQERVKAFEQSRQAEKAAAAKATPLAKEVDGAVDGVSAPVAAKKVDWKTPPEAFSKDKKPLTPPVKRSAERAYSIKTNKDGTILVSGDITQIRDAIPDSIRGRKMGDALAFTVGDAHRVKAALEGRENTYSRGGEIVKQWPVKDGKYVGAAPGFDTPGTITKWRKALRALADEGAPGRFWYENSSKAILQMAGGDVAEARKFVATLAIYSPQAKVDANSTFALRAWAQYKAGVPIKVKTGVQDRQATEILYDNKQWGGEKTGNFFTNLLREIDPSTAGKQGATIDMWMMRAGQYPTDAPTKNQYGFMENETNKLAQSLGWEPQQVQAAIWVAMKARMENSGVKKRTEASSEKRGWLRYDYPEKDGKPKKTRVIIDAQKHRDNWLKESFAHDVSKEDTLAAKFDFSDGVRRHIGQVSWEARPGRSTGVLPGVNDAPYDQQLEFQQAVSSAFYGPEGQDLLAQHLGLLADGSVFAPGVWQKEVADGQQNAIAMAPAAGDDGKKSVDPAQSKLMDIYASVIGWLTHQEGVGWHRPFYSASKRDSNGLDINVGRPLTAKEMLAVEGAIGEKMAELKVDDWQNGLGLISSPTGVRVVNFGAVENSVLQSDVMSAAADVLPDHEWRTFASSGNLVVNDWKENPDGQGYVQRASAEGRPDVFRWAADILAPRVQAVYTEYSKKYDWGDPGQIRLPATAEVKRSASRQTDTKAFKDWFGKSVVTNDDGSPKVMYHGTAQDVTEFRPKQAGAIFVTDKPEFAEDFGAYSEEWMAKNFTPTKAQEKAAVARAREILIAGGEKPENIAKYSAAAIKDEYAYQEALADLMPSRANIMPLYVSAQNPFDYENKAHVAALTKALSADTELADKIGGGFWGVIESPPVQKAIKGLGHDGFNVFEGGDKNLAVYEPTQLKSAIGNQGTFDAENPDIRKSSQRAPVFYSALAKAVSGINAKSQPAFGWKQQIEALIRKGDVKADEVQWTGLNEFLDLQQGKVSKESVEQFLSANGVRLEETMLGDRSLPKGWKVEKNDDGFVVLDQDGDEMGSGDTREEAISSAQDEDADDTKYGTYVVPGGKNYKELLLRLPVTKPTAASMKEAGWSARDNGEYWTIIDENGDGRGSAKNVDTEDAALEKWASFAATNAPGATKEYQSSHWDEPNIVAHTRIDERTDVDGDRVLFVHELQSDWGQQGKKEGFNKTNILPAAPFVTKTDSWVGLTLKRLIMHAVENNFDKVAIINGEQAADLYDLSRQVDAIRVARTSGNHFNIVAEKNGREVIDQGASSDQLENMIGKDLAQKSMSIAVGKDESYSGLDLKVGGEGMKTFYDSIVPKVAKNIAKKLGGTTSEVRVGMSWNEYLQSRDVREENGKLFARGDFELSGGALRDQYKQAHPNGQTAQFGITITPEMRETVLQKGLPLFSKTRSPYLGALDPAQQAAAKPQGKWEMPEETRITPIIRALQDKHVDLKMATKAIRDSGVALADRSNAYLQEELYHGRAARKAQAFLESEVRPLLQEVQARGMSLVDIGKYLQARHAPERNAQIAKINDDMPDGGAGITTADAKAYIAALTPEKRAAYESIAKRIDKISAGTQKSLVDGGLEKQETIDAWNGAYKHYVPLMRADMETGPGTGQGFSVRGSASKRAMGSEREVVDVVANVISQRERTITRVEKNRVAMALYGQAVAAPNPDVWKAISPDMDKAKIEADLIRMGMNPLDAANVSKEPQQRYIDPRTGMVSWRVNPLLRSAENIVSMRVNGEERYVLFNETNEQAMNIARAVKNLDANQLGQVLSIGAKISRYFSAINTQWNPLFGPVNLIRDTQGTILNLSTTPIANKVGEVMRTIPRALKEIYKIESDRAAGRPITQTAMSKMYDQFLEDGGQTGYRDLYSSSNDRAKSLEREIRRMADGKMKGAGRAVLDWLGLYNNSLENATRLAVYKSAIDAGQSRDQAASIAKNITVNFNRKGAVSAQAGALYAFFNANAQGTARMIETLNGPMGRKIVVGGILFGAAQAALLAAAGFGDDEPPEFIRERNIIIPTGDGKYITIPMPLGMHIIPNIGRVATEFALSGFKRPGDRAASLIGTLFDAFNPMGSAGLSIQTIAPTAVDPLVALAENKDFAGRPIAKENMSGLNPTPGHTRARNTASSVSKALSYGLNILSGGTEYKPGLLSPTPDQLDYLIGQVTGGVGREISKTNQTVTSIMTGEELPTYKVPLLGRFYGDINESSSQASKYYDHLKELNGHKLEIDGRRKAGQNAFEYMRENREYVLIPLAQSTQRQLSELNKLKRRMIELDKPEQVRLIEAQMKAAMRSLNARWSAIEAQ